MKFRIIYWAAGDSLQTREVEDERAAILKLGRTAGTNSGRETFFK